MICAHTHTHTHIIELREIMEQPDFAIHCNSWSKTNGMEYICTDSCLCNDVK